ncbi:MAG: hypothetical protein WC543_04250 [Candidatus Omnitrophota bacterium]
MSIKIIKFFIIVCFSLSLVSCASVNKYSFESIGNTRYSFQSGDFTNITKTYEEAASLKNKEYALWCNQLGSIYLAQGDYDKALDVFLNAHYLMNNITAFKALERKAVGLTASEDAKAYKGDPYEKAMNALYVGLLLYNKGDLENAMAAFKTGILADSDSKDESYKSDIAILFLLESRIAKKLGDVSLSKDYCSVVEGLRSNSDYSILGFDDKVIEKMLNLKNNVLLVMELGEGPYKIRRGQYGELAVINGDLYEVRDLSLKIDGKVNSDYQVYSNTDIYFQACTRGGRKMDGILKGKAVFKNNSANTAKAAINISAQLMDQANQVSDPYARAGLAAAAGISALISGGAAIMSGITNPKADIRHWTLLPEHIVIFPLAISPGKHKVSFEFNDGRYERSDVKSNYEFDVDIQKDKDNIIFKRVLNYQITQNSTGYVLQDAKVDNKLKIVKSEVNTGVSYELLSSFVDNGKNFEYVERLFGSPNEKGRDSIGREGWFYQSDKLGYSCSVYFTDGIVSSVVNEPRYFSSSNRQKVEKIQENSNGNNLVKVFSNGKVQLIIFSLLVILVFILIKSLIKNKA